MRFENPGRRKVDSGILPATPVDDGGDRQNERSERAGRGDLAGIESEQVDRGRCRRSVVE